MSGDFDGDPDDWDMETLEAYNEPFWAVCDAEETGDTTELVALLRAGRFASPAQQELLALLLERRTLRRKPGRQPELIKYSPRPPSHNLYEMIRRTYQRLRRKGLTQSDAYTRTAELLADDIRPHTRDGSDDAVANYVERVVRGGSANVRRDRNKPRTA